MKPREKLEDVKDSLPNSKNSLQGRADGLRDKMPGSGSDSSDNKKTSTNSTSPVDKMKGLYLNQRYAVKLGMGGLVLLLLVASIGGVISVQTNDILTNQVEQETVQRAELQVNQVDTWAQSTTRQAQLIASSSELSSRDVTQSQSFLANQLSGLPEEVVSAHYISLEEDGATVIASSNESYTGANASTAGLPWAGSEVTPSTFDDDQKNIHLTSPYESPDTRSQAMAFVAPVPEEDGEAVVLVIDLAEASLNLQSAQGGQTFVTTPDGTILMSTNPREIGESAPELGYAPQDTLDTAVSEQSPMFVKSYYEPDLEYNDDSHVSSYVHSNAGEMVVFTQTPHSIAYELQNQIQNLLILLIGGMIVGLGAVGSVIGVSTVRDLNNLSQTAKEVSRGNINASVTSDRTDEVGELYRSVGDMQRTLQERLNESENAEEEQRTLNNELTSVVESYRDAISSASDGDLGVRMETDADVEQLRSIAVDFNDMMDQFEESVSRAKQFSERVAVQSKEVEIGIDEVRDASNEVTASTQEISNGASQQNEKLDTTASKMNTLSKQIQSVTDATERLEQQGQQAAAKSEQGRVAAEEAAESIQSIEEQTEQSVQQVQRLNDDAEQISEVVEFISEIAEQTNMLAINARVEAARAGEAGEGFAVVADEVKTLADEASKAAGDIEDNLQSLQKNAQLTADDIKETRDAVIEGAETVTEAIDSLEGIAEDVEATYDVVKEIDSATELQAETAQDAVEMVDESAHISEETASQAQSVAAASEEQSASIQQVSSSVSEFAEEATTLADLLEEFDVSDDETQD